jgi:hypothetical protein
MIEFAQEKSLYIAKRPLSQIYIHYSGLTKFKMKLLVKLLLFLCLFQHTSALIPRLHFRSHEEQEYAEIEDRSLICKLDAVLLACKVLGAQATTFCSSYLHISTTTVIVSKTTPTYVQLLCLLYFFPRIIDLSLYSAM